MTRRQVILAAALTVISSAVLSSSGTAQAAPATAALDTAMARARRLVGEGQGVAGRALMDSLVVATPDTAGRYPELLFWRASLAADAAGAERDYRRIAVEYTLSPRAEDALMRLAQLELARGDRARALKHLERLTLEHPSSPSRARAGYWMARVYFDGGDAPRACAALDGARAGAAPTDVELRNQIDYLGKRCGGAGGGSRVASVAPAPAPIASAPPVAADTSTGGVPATAAVERPGASDRGVVPNDSGALTRPSAASARPTITSPTINRPSPLPATRTPAPAPHAFSVQIAAFETQPPAASLAARLAKRGLAARVAGTRAPFRVRVGRYATREEAAAAARRMKAQKIDGLVVEAEAR